MFKSKLYSLRKANHVLHSTLSAYNKRGKKLSTEQKEIFKENITKLKAAIDAKDRQNADLLARKAEQFSHTYLKKSFFDYTFELIVALIFALAVATVVRQMWFELYEIPTGSMRPTFFEQDHLTVSKLAYGINTPLKTEHLYFNPELVQRTSIVIFSGDKIPVIDSDTTYFGLLPYKKRYIKRSMGKPGDTVYFYGGQLYGYDKDGHEIREFLDSPWMKNLEHIPFLNFEGRMSLGERPDQVIFKQMNLPVGRLSFLNNKLIGEVYNGEKWVKDRPSQERENQTTIQSYGDLWGIRNFAMARILTKKQMQELHPDAGEMEEGLLYLELRHNPSFSYPTPIIQQDPRGVMILLNPQVSIIPLKQTHLDLLMDHMYTARFVVKDQVASRYNVEGNHFDSTSPRLPGMPNGTYEFYFGKLSKIGWGGIPTEASDVEALMAKTPENVQRLFNLGIEWDISFNPRKNQQIFYPQRYAYFRNGELYLLGAPIFKKEDPLLVSFISKEEEKQQQASANTPYVAFKDYGPPLNKDGSLNKEFIKTFGLEIPDRHYLVLGDNHAMSSDSRVFGFVPENNLQGAPSLILWPPGDRVGHPLQKPYPIINFQRLLIWSIVAAIAGIWYLIHRRKQRSLKFNF